MKLDRETIQSKVISFVNQKKSASEISVTENTRVFSTGLLDSLAFMEIMLFIEEEFGQTLAQHGEVTFESMDRVGNIVDAIVKAREHAEGT